jgi:hypothetical protein
MHVLITALRTSFVIPLPPYSFLILSPFFFLSLFLSSFISLFFPFHFSLFFSYFLLLFSVFVLFLLTPTFSNYSIDTSISFMNSCSEITYAAWEKYLFFFNLSWNIVCKEDLGRTDRLLSFYYKLRFCEKSKLYCDRWSAGQSVLVSGTHLGPATEFSPSFFNYFF